MSSPLRASNEVLPRARVARAQGTHRGILPLRLPHTLEGPPSLRSTARIERAPFHRARSASKGERSRVPQDAQKGRSARPQRAYNEGFPTCPLFILPPPFKRVGHLFVLPRALSEHRP